MLRCRDGSFDVGHTDDLERRLAEHHAGAHDGYTCKRRPLELVWCAELSTRLEETGPSDCGVAARTLRSVRTGDGCRHGSDSGSGISASSVTLAQDDRQARERQLPKATRPRRPRRTSRATRLSPPSGTIRSAQRLDGSTYSRCIGRTVA